MARDDALSLLIGCMPAVAFTPSATDRPSPSVPEICGDGEIAGMWMHYLRQQQGDVAACLNGEVPEVSGRWRVSVEVDRDGRAKVLGVEGLNLPRFATFEACLTNTVQSWTFEPICRPLTFQKTWRFQHDGSSTRHVPRPRTLVSWADRDTLPRWRSCLQAPDAVQPQ